VVQSGQMSLSQWFAESNDLQTMAVCTRCQHNENVCRFYKSLLQSSFLRYLPPASKLDTLLFKNYTYTTISHLNTETDKQLITD